MALSMSTAGRVLVKDRNTYNKLAKFQSIKLLCSETLPAYCMTVFASLTVKKMALQFTLRLAHTRTHTHTHQELSSRPGRGRGHTS